MLYTEEKTSLQSGGVPLPRVSCNKLYAVRCCGGADETSQHRHNEHFFHSFVIMMNSQ